MPTAAEAVGAKTPLASDLAEGVKAIASNQKITFRRYVRLVLPADGYVFWVKAELLSESAIFNAARLNGTPFNSPASVSRVTKTKIVTGSLHYATDTRQEEAETYAVNRVVFTAPSEVEDLNAIAPNELWLAEFQGVRFAFTGRKAFYKQADLYHYFGDAVYADMEPQIVDRPEQFDAKSVIVSNSLPIWLSMNGYDRPAWLPFAPPPATFYPSFLVDDNIRPPFVSVHVVPDSTKAIGGAPVLGRTLSHSQLASERVRLTIWGLRNDEAQTLVDFVNQFTLETDLIGIMNQPILRDEKRTQSELSTIAMKKVIEFDVSYYQTAARDVARQTILSAVPTVTTI